MSITGDADGEGGHPTKVGVAISDLVTGLYAVIGILAALLERGRSGRAGPAGRRLAPRRDPGRPRQPGPERVRHGPPARAPRQRPPQHRARTRRSRPPTASWPWPSARSASGRACARCSSARTWPPTRASRRTATGSSIAPSCGRSSPSASRPGSSAAWLADLEAAEIPAGAIADVVDGLRLRRGGGPGHARRGRAPGPRRAPPGRHPAALRAHAGRRSGRRRRSSASMARRSSASSATTTRRSPGCAPAAWCRQRPSTSVHPRSPSPVGRRTSR